MRRAKLILGVSTVMMAMMVAFAAPAMADDWDWNDDHCWSWGFWVCDDGFDDHGFFGGDGFGDFEQDADSGDIDQSFDVTGGGDNSNQTVGLQGVVNTGNAQNQIGITQIGSDVDNNNWWNNNGDNFSDFSFEDSGASIEVSPENSTTSDQEVNQAASAFGK